MLTNYLKNTLADLEELILLTESDIKDIKTAKHDSQFDRLELKEEKIKSFEQNKAMIDSVISSLVASNSQIELPNFLTSEQHLLLDDLKVKLARLHEVNREYARLVAVVSNLYNTFLERLVPTEMQGYNKVPSKGASILQVRV